jgi:hypothetical protein
LRDEEAIAKYLTQKMTDVERSAFEQKMSENPQLGQKVKFEEQIVEGIKNYQKGILKTRLNQLEIVSSLAEMTSITTKQMLDCIHVQRNIRVLMLCLCIEGSISFLIFHDQNFIWS